MLTFEKLEKIVSAVKIIAPHLAREAETAQKEIQHVVAAAQGKRWRRRIVGKLSELSPTIRLSIRRGVGSKQSAFAHSVVTAFARVGEQHFRNNKILVLPTCFEDEVLNLFIGEEEVTIEELEECFGWAIEIKRVADMLLDKVVSTRLRREKVKRASVLDEKAVLCSQVVRAWVEVGKRNALVGLRVRCKWQCRDCRSKGRRFHPDTACRDYALEEYAPLNVPTEGLAVLRRLVGNV